MGLFGDPKMAMCPSCNEPLISTFAFRGYEFYCLCCGRHLEFLKPVGAEVTPELTARQEALQAEWDEHAGRKLLISGWYDDCELCKARDEGYHREHATNEERDADRQAREWLVDRAKRKEPA
ncbi:MAG TPA: hypothetical protein VGF95_14610 [Solirubrobacteraceae bacterium]|jgi:hypothetical protein